MIIEKGVVKMDPQTVPGVSTGDGIIMFVSFVIYLLPMFIAMARKHKNTAAIAVVNIFLGWTILGWIMALVWAVAN